MRGVSLANADLSYSNLSNANLDGGDFTGADFTGANLAGANMSEINAQRANFSSASLVGTCLADSDCTAANFEGASFGGTIIAGACLDLARFDTLSALLLPYFEASSMKAVKFKSLQGGWHHITKPPIVIHGAFTSPLVILDHKILIGHKALDRFDLDVLFKILLSNNVSDRCILTEETDTTSG